MADNKKKRNETGAGLLSFLCPGLGQIYVGKLNRGLVVMSLLLLVYIGGAWAGLPETFYGYVLWMAGVFGFYFYQIWDAGRLAKQVREISLQKYNRWYWYVVAVVLYAILWGLITENRDRILGYGMYRIPSGAMTPTLMIGDFIVSKSGGSIKNNLHRNDLVIHQHPNEPSVMYIKRVVAVGGDSFSIEGGKSVINGTPLNESYVVQSNNTRPESQKFGPIKVPEGHVFVLGDNRDHSNDSRYWGTLPINYVVAKPLYVWMSFDQSKGIVWERIGKTIGE